MRKVIKNQDNAIESNMANYMLSVNPLKLYPQALFCIIFFYREWSNLLMHVGYFVPFENLKV